MNEKLRTYGRVFSDSFTGWLALVGTVFSVFAIFSAIVTANQIGLSYIFTAFSEFYAGFRNNIFWPFQALLSWTIPATAQDIILFWSISGAIAVRALLWFTDQMHGLATQAHEKASDPENRAAYIRKHGQQKYDEELAFVTEQRERTRRPEGRLIFGIVSFLVSLVVGPLGFAYIAIVNPHHDTIAVSGREFLAIHVVVVVAALLAFFLLNFLLPATPPTSPA